MNNSAAPRSARTLIAAVAVVASVLSAACSNPVGPREAVAAPSASAAAQQSKGAAAGDSTNTGAATKSGGYTGGGTIPWY